MAVAVHPFAAVTVTVYVPGAEMESVALVPTLFEPFDQVYETPPVAVIGIEVVVQLRSVVAGILIAAIGAIMFWLIVCVAVAVHPFAPVTVTVYVPGTDTGRVEFDPTTVVPLDQE